MTNPRTGAAVPQDGGAANWSPSTETLEAIYRAYLTRNAALKAYREAVGVGVVGDSLAASLALISADTPEYKALEKARDELRSLATNHAGDMVAEIWRLRALLSARGEPK